MGGKINENPKYFEVIYEHLENAEYAYFDLVKLDPSNTLLEKQYYDTEVKCFGLMIEKGSLLPIMEFNSSKTTDISLLSTEEIEYIKGRALVEKRHYLVARYNHILFLLLKNNNHAHMAIQAYYSLAKDYFSKLYTEKHHVNGFISLVEAYVNLSISTKYEIVKCKAQLFKWFNQQNQHLYYYESFLRLFVEIKIVKREDLNGYIEKSLNIFESHKTDSHNEDFLEVCVLLAKKEGVSTKPIYRLMADTQLALIKEALHDNSELLENQRLVDAAKFYKLAGDYQQSKDILVEINEHKKTIQFDIISHTIGKTDLDVIKECAKNIAIYHLKQHPETIFFPIALDKRIVPQLGKGFSEENSFLRTINTSYYDINLNCHHLTDFELDRREAFQGFQFELELSLPFYFSELIKEMSNQKRNIVTEGLHYFENTWFRRILKKGPQDNSIEYSWMPMLKPALEILIRANNEERRQQLTYEEQMSFDQLAIKFEGLLRDICSLAKINTIKVYDNQTVAKDINELLQTKELANVFQDEDIRLWQYTFTGCGYNIRNNVAHAFYLPKDYTITLSNILILAYIKLAKYGNVINQAPKNETKKSEN